MLYPSIFYLGILILSFISVSYAGIPFFTPPLIQFGIRLTENIAGDERFHRLRIEYALISVPVSMFLIALFVEFQRYLLSYSIVQFPVLEIAIQFGVYYYIRTKVRAVKDSFPKIESSNSKVTAVFQGGLASVGIFLYLIPWIELVIFIVAGILLYPSMPDKLATHFALDGKPDSYQTKSFFSVFSLIVFIGIPATLIIQFISWHSRSIPPTHNPTSPMKSGMQMNGFNSKMVKTMFFLNILILLTLFLNSLVIWGILSASLIPLFIFPLIIFLFVVIIIFYISGQGGWKLYPGLHEHSSGNIMIDDDSKWIAGVIYHNRNDPFFLVPKRFGIGYTLNFSNVFSWLFITLIIFIPLLFILKNSLY